MRFSATAKVLLPATLLLALAACEERTAPLELAPANRAVSYSNSPKPNLHLVESKSWTMGESVSVVVTPSGGVVRVANHQLVVPKSAVAHPTVFTMAVQNGNKLIVDLSAVDRVTGQVVDTFAKPVLLILSYGDLNVAPDEQRDLTVVWLEDDSADGRLVPVRSAINPATQHATGWLTHFSQYAMGMN